MFFAISPVLFHMRECLFCLPTKPAPHDASVCGSG